MTFCLAGVQVFNLPFTKVRHVASVPTRTISEFTSLRQEMRTTAERVPPGV